MVSTIVERDGYADLSHHLSVEARERLPNMMKVFLRTVEDASQLVSLANGTPSLTLVRFIVDRISHMVSLLQLFL